MTYKARWISFWVTLAYWLGSAGGCANTENQNTIQAILDEHPHQKQVEDNVLEEGAPEPETPQPEAALKVAPESETNPPKAAQTIKPSPISETAPSLRGLDRSKWPRIVVGPAQGSTPHGLILFKDLPADLGTPKDVEPHYAELNLEVVKLPAEDFSRVNANATVSQSQILEALGDTQPQNWSAQNGAHLLLQPLKVSLDLLAAPFHQFNDADSSDPITDLILTPAHFVQDLFQSDAEAETDPFQPELPENEDDWIPHNETPDLSTDQPRNVSIEAPNDALDSAPDGTPQDTIQQDDPKSAPDDTPQDTPQQDEPPAPMK